MPNFQQRSHAKELLDDAGIPFAAIAQNMRELDLINQRLGGHRVTLKGIQSILKGKSNILKKPVEIVEIGCGGGDNLYAIQQWAQQKKLAVQLTGVDINEACIAFAKAQARNGGIRFIASDYKSVLFANKPHIIFSSLFCHHFSDEEICFQLQWMRQNVLLGFFINDLHRHPLAYHSIKTLTALFSKSYLVKNDAPLSVLRGFKKGDWQLYFQKAEITNYNSRWQWAFRWLVTGAP